MHAFDFFYTIIGNYGHLAESKEPYSDSSNPTMLEMYRTAERSIDMYSGELHPFAADPLFADGFISFMESNPHVALRIVCGDFIACAKDEETGELYNPLLRAIEMGKIQGKVYYNNLSITKQIWQKYSHSSIIDGGKRVMVEIPHDYDAHTNHEKLHSIHRVYFSDCANVANLLLETYDDYILFNELNVISSFGTGVKLRHYKELNGELNEGDFPSIYSEEFRLNLVS
jgi:hypothetical protein